MTNSVIHWTRLLMLMDIQNISKVDTMNQHTFAVNVLADLRPMLIPTAMKTIDNGYPMGKLVHEAEFQVLILATMRMDILAMIYVVVVTMATVGILYSAAYCMNDVFGDSVAFVASL